MLLVEVTWGVAYLLALRENVTLLPIFTPKLPKKIKSTFTADTNIEIKLDYISIMRDFMEGYVIVTLYITLIERA